MIFFLISVILFQGCFASHIDLPVTENTFDYGSISISASSLTTQGIRPAQEDRISMYKKKDQWSCAVFDGHGGQTVAERLSQSNDGLLPYLMDGTNASLSIAEKYKKFNEDNFSAPEFNKVGSTAVTVGLDVLKNKFFMAHCGDSLGLLINRTTGEIVYQTVAHSPVFEKDRITNLGGLVFHGRVNGLLAVARSFGDRGYEGFDGRTREDNGKKLVIPDPDVFEKDLSDLPEQTVGLLFSDGFSDCFSKYSNTKFFKNLAKITLCLLERGQPIETLSQDLVLLMNRSKTMKQIKEDVLNKDLTLDDLFKQTTVDKSSDNVSLIAFEIKKTPDNVDNRNEPEQVNKTIKQKEAKKDLTNMLETDDKLAQELVLLMGQDSTLTVKNNNGLNENSTLGDLSNLIESTLQVDNNVSLIAFEINKTPNHVDDLNKPEQGNKTIKQKEAKKDPTNMSETHGKLVQDLFLLMDQDRTLTLKQKNDLNENLPLGNLSNPTLQPENNVSLIAFDINKTPNYVDDLNKSEQTIKEKEPNASKGSKWVKSLQYVAKLFFNLKNMKKEFLVLKVVTAGILLSGLVICGQLIKFLIKKFN